MAHYCKWKAPFTCEERVWDVPPIGVDDAEAASLLADGDRSKDRLCANFSLLSSKQIWHPDHEQVTYTFGHHC